MSRQHLDNQYHGTIPQWQIAAAVAMAKQLGFRPEDIQDALQEIAIELLSFTYDPAKGANERTAARTVIRNTLLNLLRGRTRQARNTEAFRRDHRGEPETGDAHAAADLWDAVGSLDAADQTICRCLAEGMSTHQITQALGMTWYRVDRAIGRIRERLLQLGIEAPCHG
jgi:RNA polymerase sigma factor (sigma-70 family)